MVNIGEDIRLEKNEYEIYLNASPDQNHLSRKDFRRILSERKNMRQFIDQLCTHRCDVFDYMI